MAGKISPILLCLVVLKLMPVKYSAETTLYGAFYDTNLQKELNLAAKNLSIVANSSIVTRTLSLNHFIDHMKSIGENMAAGKSERSFLFTDFLLLTNELTREIVQAEINKVDNGSSILVVDNVLNGEHWKREDPLYGLSEHIYEIDKLADLVDRLLLTSKGISILVDGTKHGEVALTRLIEKASSVGRQVLGMLIVDGEITEDHIETLNGRGSNMNVVDTDPTMTADAVKMVDNMGLAGFNDTFAWIMTNRSTTDFDKECSIMRNLYIHTDPKRWSLNYLYVISKVTGCIKVTGNSPSITCDSSFQSTGIKYLKLPLKRWTSLDVSDLPPTNYAIELNREITDDPDVPLVKVSIGAQNPPWIYFQEASKTSNYGITCGRGGKLGYKTGNSSSERETVCMFGFAMDILKVLERKLGFASKIYVSRDGLYGSYNEESGKATGIVREILENEADLGIDLIETKGRNAALEFSRSYHIDSIAMAYLKRESHAESGVFGPFSTHLWLVYIGTIAGLVIFLWSFERVSPYSQYQQNKRKAETGATVSFFDCAIYVWGTMHTGEIIENKPQSFSSHVTTIFIAFMSILIISAYSGNLVTYLVVINEKPPVTGLYDEKLIGKSSTLRVGQLEGAFAAGYLETHSDVRLRNLYKRIHFCSTHEKCWDGLKQGLFDIYMYDFLTLTHQISIDHECSAGMIRVPNYNAPIGLAFRKDSTWKKRWNSVVTDMVGTGEADIVVNRWFQKTNCKNPNTFYALDIKRMNGIFIVLASAILGCILLALAVIPFERRHVRRKQEAAETE